MEATRTLSKFWKLRYGDAFDISARDDRDEAVASASADCQGISEAKVSWTNNAWPTRLRVETVQLLADQGAATLQRVSASSLELELRSCSHETRRCLPALTRASTHVPRTLYEKEREKGCLEQDSIDSLLRAPTPFCWLPASMHPLKVNCAQVHPPSGQLPARVDSWRPLLQGQEGHFDVGLVSSQSLN